MDEAATDTAKKPAKPRWVKTFGPQVIAQPDKTLCQSVTPESVREIIRKVRGGR